MAEACGCIHAVGLMKSCFWAFSVALAILWLGQGLVTAATVVTDQIDYPPDTTATINGSGFLPGETVELQVLNLTTPTDTGAEHDPWTVGADINGDFQTTWYVTADETNQTLELTATGLTSGLVAQRVFTDSVTVAHVSLNISADTAADAATPAWTPLGNLKVSENNKADFSAGHNLTLILKAPAGWQFNTAATPVTTFSGPEITAASTAVSDASTLTVTATVTDNKKASDIFTIAGIQVRPTAGQPLSTGMHIYHPSTGGGNWNINGISASSDGSSGTSFGDLIETNGGFAGYVITGTNVMTAGTSKNLTIQKTDQFGIAVSNSSTAMLTFSGLGSVGTNNPKINSATTAFSGGVSVAFNSAGLATTTLTLIPYKVETATLNVTDGTKTSAAVGGGLVLTVSAAAASKLVFTSTAVSTATGVASGNLTVQRQDQFGNPVTTEGARIVVLTSSSTGTVTFNPASLSIASGSSSANFTYTDSKAGTSTLTAASTSPGTITSATQVATITKAGTSVAVSSSINPSGFGAAVSFTATLPANATGSILFLTNGAVYGTVSLAGGFASSSATTLLPRGTNTITAAYAGDANYLGSTNNLAGGQIVTNHPPVANASIYSRKGFSTWKIYITDLLINVTDVDGDSLTLAGVGVSTNGLTLTADASWVYYYNSNIVNDRFDYTVSDGFGGTVVGVVYLTMTNNVSAIFGQNTTIGVTNGVASLTFYGIPTYSYGIGRTTNLVDWKVILTTNAPANGAFHFNDNFADLGAVPAAAYYRLQWNP